MIQVKMFGWYGWAEARSLRGKIMNDGWSVMSDAKTIMPDGVLVMSDGHVDEEARDFGFLVFIALSSFNTSRVLL